ncbi:nucleotidyltransferase domain-containing protein [Microbacterium sp. BWR-S6Y]|uniref:nucleotidyltransferase domain-containing protein n=1 Tax=Microbacterium sp. BWR-S6Y TaxID=3232073 RepID=UPI0035273704
MSSTTIEAHQARLADLSDHVSDTAIAAMVYGSYARGTDDEGSDIDILELVADSPSPRSSGRINVTQYTPAHLAQMSQRGSLFVMHLIADGKVLHDPHGTLERTLSQYAKPVSFAPIWEQLSAAAGIVNPRSPDASEHSHGLGRLGMYVLRTAAYLHAIEQGNPCFDVDAAAKRLGVRGLSEVLRWRRSKDFTLDQLSAIAEVLPRVLPLPVVNEDRSVLSFAVAHSTSQDMAALFMTVLGDGQIEYSALTVPPF